MPGIEVDLNESSPRDLIIVDDKIYFTNWNSQDIKIFNLFNYALEGSISVSGLPEGIVEKDGYLWVAIAMNSDWSPASQVVKIDINTQSIVDTYEVGQGPQALEFNNGNLYVSRTYYDSSWIPYHGISKISD